MTRAAGVLLCLAAVPAAAAGPDLSGTWELEILGDDGRTVAVQHQGSDVRVYRQLHPEFEGQRYLLEHLFRGRLQGSRITGDLMVREEAEDGQLTDFEVLRPFKGELLPGPILVIDGKRAHREPNWLGKRPAAPARPAPPPAAAGAPPTANAPAAGSDPDPSGAIDGAAEAPTADEIEQFVGGPDPQVVPASKAHPELHNPAQERRNRDYTRRLVAGDRHLAGGRPAQALLEYVAAHKADRYKVSVFSRIAEAAERVGKKDLALRFWRRQLRVDPEDVRARKRIAHLSQPAEASEGAQP